MPVAQYLRMSTEHQRYSIANQSEAIAKYVAEHQMAIVRTYEDSGKSGLTINKRVGLQNLLADVLSRKQYFRCVVVLDVSRWGRFQDVDESAFYEFICRRAGVDVVYCAEPFSGIDGPMGVIIKSVKRAMAAEYSRELSSKIFAAQSRLARMGYHACGEACFGLKRVQVTAEGTVVRDLPPHELKSRHEDHVELAPADPLDGALIRAIFNLYVNQRISAPQIALRLNWSCYPGPSGLTPWRQKNVRSVLANENYIGTYIWGKHTQKLRTNYRLTPRSNWIVFPHGFEAIVSEDSFRAAKHLLHSHKWKWSDEAMLDLLRKVHAKHGYVNGKLLYSSTDAPGTVEYQRRFGSLADACKLIGVPATPLLEVTSVHSKQRQHQRLRLFQWLDERYAKIGVGFYWHPYNRRACAEGALTFSVRSVHAQRTRNSFYWELRPDREIQPDVCVFIRLSLNGEEVLDFFVIPGDNTQRYYINSKGIIPPQLEPFRCTTLEQVFRRLEVARNSGEMRIPDMLLVRRHGTERCPRVHLLQPDDTPRTSSQAFIRRHRAAQLTKS